MNGAGFIASQRTGNINTPRSFGRWERDLKILQRTLFPANALTLVVRRARFIVLLKNNDRKSKPTMHYLIEASSPLPHFTPQSITFDRGFEFVSWSILNDGLGVL